MGSIKEQETSELITMEAGGERKCSPSMLRSPIYFLPSRTRACTDRCGEPSCSTSTKKPWRYSGLEKVMVHLRSTRAAIVLFLSLIALEDFAGLGRRDIAAYGKSHEELGGETRTIVGAIRKEWLRGRMMVMEEVTAARSTANTGADHLVSQCGNEGDGSMRSGCELKHRSRPVRVHYAGLVPFSSDYSAPRNHPPKNN
ncbi:hypothetical protein MUK42_31683 [Musa troglodytarum]|uniref:Uncharacterized protein n=1 Tax=Musa troglodytarum TaxID=320322 RepID=A0A9E7JY73_9LILI|nr:hypothetical protein MUK42_31683 [Musa troglodytarum]